MRVINIIVHDNDTGIISIDSFGIVDEQLSSDVTQEAEDFFIQKCVDLKFGEGTNTTRDDLRERNDYRDEVSEELEDGYVHIDRGLVTVSFVWSSIENVQL